MIPFASAARPCWGEPKEVWRQITAIRSIAAGRDTHNRQPTSSRHTPIEVAHCALEAVVVPIVLGAPRRMVSACRATGEPVSVTIGADGSLREVRPGDAVVGCT